MIQDEGIYTTKRKPRKCPNCGSKKVAKILYAPSALHPELLADIAAGKAVLRACCLKGPIPSWECLFCGMQIAKKQEQEEMSLF